MKTRFILSLISAFVIGFLLSLAVTAFGVNVDPIVGGAVTATVLVISGVISWFTSSSKLNTLTALQKEVWVADIMDNLFLGMEFVKRSIDDSIYVNNKTVHVPQAGAVPSIVKNRSVFPATISEREDDELTYDIAHFSTDPIRVRNFDDVQVSYDKRQSVLGEHVSALSERMGDEIAQIWSPTGDANLVLRTTGDGSAANLPNGTATGTRRKLVKEDVARMARKLDKDKMPKDGRTLMLSPEMYYEMFEVDALVRADYMNSGKLPEGVINRLFGFDIIVRDTICLYNNATPAVKKAIGAAEAATDCLGGLAWSKYATRRALGSIGIYLNEGQAEHYGDIMSAEVWFGGEKSRTDSKGIVAIAQGYIAP